MLRTPAGLRGVFERWSLVVTHYIRAWGEMQPMRRCHSAQTVSIHLLISCFLKQGFAPVARRIHGKLNVALLSKTTHYVNRLVIVSSSIHSLVRETG